uniref:Ubiquitin-like protease family profile domain-containing protein n=1 Tax=Setaria italica TaxID=4555 RepID=K4AKT9_SETIT
MRVLLDDDKKPVQNELFKVDQTYDYLPQDYCSQITIEASLSTDLLVKINDIFVTQAQLLCLLDLEIFLNDDVISAYICCIKDQAHLQSRDDVKFYFENPFISEMLKRDGNVGLNGDGNCITKIVLIPINIKDTHWYLAVINTQRCEIQVLDLLCWEFNRGDLTATQNLISHNWKGLQVTTWTITEQLQAPIQKDSSWNARLGRYYLILLYRFEDINHFRFKLAGILLCWKTNTTGSNQIHATEANANDVSKMGSLDGQKEPKASEPLSEETKYKSLMSVLYEMSANELISGICDYIQSITCAKTLDLTVKKLQEILKEDLPIDHDSFNLVIQKFMLDGIQMVKKTRGSISKHYLDIQFWMITDFGRHPNFRKKLDVEQLATFFHSWPSINYSVSSCKLILIPILESNGAFNLVILDQDTRNVYILDPTLLDPIYQYNPNAKYVKKLLCIAEYLAKAMSKACPGPDGMRIFSYGFMFIWKDAELHLPVLKDGYELRKQILAQLLTYKENECEDNMPAGVQDFLNCIKATQSYK